MQETAVRSPGWEDPLEKGKPTHSSILRLPFTAQLVKNLPAVQDTLVRFLGREDPLEKGKAAQPSILGLPWWLSW